MPEDKYKMFKNYMTNELGISKDDIRQWVKEAVSEEARKVIAQTYETYSLRDIIKSVVRDVSFSGSQHFKQDVIKAAGACLAERMEIKMKQLTDDPRVREKDNNSS